MMLGFAVLILFFRQEQLPSWASKRAADARPAVVHAPRAAAPSAGGRAQVNIKAGVGGYGDVGGNAAPVPSRRRDAKKEEDKPWRVGMKKANDEEEDGKRERKFAYAPVDKVSCTFSIRIVPPMTLHYTGSRGHVRAGNFRHKPANQVGQHRGA
jgi:hypothetical protein